MINYKEIHIGTHLKEVSKVKEVSISRACQFLKCSSQEIEHMYTKQSLDSNTLLRWCKLLDYNFFMFYNSHLQLFNPSAATAKLKVEEVEGDDKKYIFRKNLYSPEIIDWILGQLRSGELDIKSIMQKYQIPRTTIYRWSKRDNVIKKEEIIISKKRSEVSFKALYFDFLKQTPNLSFELKVELKEYLQLLSKDNLSTKDLMKLNSIIKQNTSYKTDEKRYQQLKSYDEDYILDILEYQRINKLSDRYVCISNKLSRNTLAKWKKRYKN